VDKALLGLFAANITDDNLNPIKGKEFYIRVNKFFANGKSAKIIYS
jgi:hypothetical protein